MRVTELKCERKGVNLVITSFGKTPRGTKVRLTSVEVPGEYATRELRRVAIEQAISKLLPVVAS